jgi:biotin carboxyl carrier protein
VQYEVEVQGRLREVHVHRVNGRFVVAVDGKNWTVDAAFVDPHMLSLLVEEPIPPQPGSGGDEAVRVPPVRSDGSGSGPAGAGPGRTSSHEVTIAQDPATGLLLVRVGETPLVVSINGRRRWGRKEEALQTGSGPLRIIAPMPGKIVRVLVKKGAAVRARQSVVIVEAMKMENELRSACDGTLTEIHVEDGQSVEAGALLAVIHR